MRIEQEIGQVNGLLNAARKELATLADAVDKKEACEAIVKAHEATLETLEGLLPKKEEPKKDDKKESDKPKLPNTPEPGKKK